MTTKALSSSGGLNNPTRRVGVIKSDTRRLERPNRMNNSWAVIRSYISCTVSSPPKQSMVANKRPAIEARSCNGMRSKSEKVDTTCPNGEGRVGKDCSENWLRNGIFAGILGSFACEIQGLLLPIHQENRMTSL